MTFEEEPCVTLKEYFRYGTLNFWLGVCAGAFGMFVTCVILGIFVS